MWDLVQRLWTRGHSVRMQEGPPEGDVSPAASIGSEGDTMRRGILLAAILAALLLWGAEAPAAIDQKGTLVVVLDTLGAQTMDPILETRAPHAHYQAPVFDALVGFDYEKGGLGPGAAERWELSQDGGSWIFHLRKGLKWHNGDPVTAHDVKFSLERSMSPESLASRAAALRGQVERIEVMDDYTVRVYTKGTQPHFPSGVCPGQRSRACP